MREAVIVAAARTAVGKSRKGVSRNVRSDEMAAIVIRDLIRQSDGKLDPMQVDDVLIGCAMPEGEQGLNFARTISLRAGLPVDVPSATINRFCSSGLQAVAQAAERIIANGADIIIAGGAETMSGVPMSGFHISPNPYMAENEPEVYMSMGLTAEQVADEFGVTREEMDEFAYQSHVRAAAAIDAGRFNQQIVPFEVEEVYYNDDGERVVERFMLDQDEHLRRETTVDQLLKLKPAFQQGGRVTAGNSSPLSDGAAAVMVMEAETAARLGFTPIARFVGFAVAGVRPEIMGVGPIKAIPKLLTRHGVRLDEVDLIELNEAFAAQSLAVIRNLEIDPARVNVNGGAIALGHPLGCTGAKLTTQLMYEFKDIGGKYGMVTMCIGGGMGAAGLFENLLN
ncbi:MAG: thiolase family protein [Phototrophicaceae bacterium]